MIFKDSHFVIFDTEFTAWKGSLEREWSGKNERREIVKLSALKIKVGKTLTVVEKLDIFVKPKINPLLSTFFIELTNISQKDVKTKGISFKKALEIFFKFCHHNKSLLKTYSYGDDYSVLKENMRLNKISIPIKNWKQYFHDIRAIFSTAGIDTNKYTSGTVYKAFKIKPPTTVKVHDSSWDVYSLFLSLQKIRTDMLLKTKSL